MGHPYADSSSDQSPPGKTTLPEKGHKPSVWRRWRTLIIVTLLLGGVYTFTSYGLGPIVAKRLSKQIQEQSEGLYRLEVDAARINLLQSQLLVKNVRLRADSSIKSDSGLLIEADIPLLRIALPFRQLFEQGPIELTDLYLAYPEVTATGRPKKGNRFDLYAILKQKLQIGHIEIEEGKLSLSGGEAYKHTFVIRDLNLKMDSLLIDSTSWRYSDLEMEASLADLVWPLADSIHNIQLGSLSFSSENKSLTAANLKLQPEGFDSLDFRAHINLPKLALRGFQLEEFLQKKELRLSSINIDIPEIRLIGKPPSSNFSSGTTTSLLDKLYPVIRPFIKRIKADQIQVKDARLVQYGLDNKKLRLIEGLNISLEGFDLDSIKRKQMMRSRDIRLEADAYSFNLGEDYELRGKGLWLSTLSRFFQADSLQLIPRRPSSPYEISIPSLIVEGLDANDTWFNKQVIVEKIHIAEPDILVRRAPDVEANTIADLAEQDLYSLIAGTLKGIEVKELEMEGGKVRLNFQEAEPFRAKDAALWIKDFRLRPGQNSTSRPFNAADVRMALNVDQYAFTLPDSSHQLKLQGLRVSTADSAILIDSLSLVPLRSNTASSLTMLAPSVAFYGLNALSLLRDRRLEVDRLSLREPMAILNRRKGYAKTQLSPQQLHRWATRRLIAIGLRKLELIDAQFTDVFEGTDGNDSLHFPSSDLLLQNVLLNEMLPPEENDWRFMDRLKITSRQLSNITPDSSHIIQLDSIQFDTDDAVCSIHGTSIRANNTAQHGPGLYGNIPTAELGGLAIFDIIQNKQIDLDVIRIISPDVIIRQGTDTLTTPLEDLKPEQFIPDYIEGLSIGGIQVEYGKGRYVGHSLPSDTFTVEDIQFQVQGVSYAAKKAPLSVKDIALSLYVDDAHFVTPDSSLEIRLGYIGIRKSGQEFYIDSVEIHSFDQSRQGFNLLVPRVVFEGVQLMDIWKKKKASLDAIKLLNPVCHISGSGDVKLSRSDIRRYMQGHGLYRMIAPLLDTLEAGTVSIESGKLSMKPKQGIHWLADDISLTLTHFLVDQYQRANRYFYADDMDLEVCHQQLLLPDSLYHLKIGNWRLQTKQNRIEVESLYLIPQLGMYEFAASRDYALDRADLHIPRIRAMDIDLNTLFGQQRVDMKQLQIFSPTLELFRNAQLPDSFPPEQSTMQELLRRVPFPLHVDSTYITNARIRYALHEDDADRPGILSFDDVTLSGTAFSNDTAFHKTHPETIFDGQCRVMDSVDLNLRFRFTHGDKSDPYTITGVMGAAPDLKVFNPMLEPAGFVSIRDGSAEKLIFSIDADRYNANGRMRFYYDDLRVKVLSKKKETFKGFESFMANSFVLRKNNPRARFLRVGRIDYQRDVRRSVFRFWAKSFLSGIQSSLGLRSKEGRITNKKK